MQRGRAAVERASSSDAFGLLGLPARFDLDPAVIEAAFFERSKELHPDKHANAPAAERFAILSRSRALNDAYQTLKKPISRAEYLLEREGLTIGENERIDLAIVMRVLGIDLGTTNSLVAHVADASPTVLGDDPIVPSVVYYGEQIVVGRDAQAKALDAPRDTLASVKRLVGRGLA